MNELALFAGAGGGLLGTRLLGFRPVCAVEIDSYCRESLIRRQEEGHLEPFPIWDDVRTFDGLPWRGLVDVVTGGFPCQPFSQAGKQLGEHDERNMWPETIRVIREVAPSFVFLENVPRLLRNDYFRTILGEIAEAGFDAEWDVVSAAEVGAPHLRERLWILAYSNGIRWKQIRRNKQHLRKRELETNISRLESKRRDDPNSDGQRQSRRKKLNLQKKGSIENEEWEYACGLDLNVPNSNSERLQDGPQKDRHNKQKDSKRSWMPTERSCQWWSSEPEVGRVVDGLANRVDQLRATGNGQVPRVVVEAWNRLIERISS